MEGSKHFFSHICTYEMFLIVHVNLKIFKNLSPAVLAVSFSIILNENLDNFVIAFFASLVHCSTTVVINLI